MTDSGSDFPDLSATVRDGDRAAFLCSLFAPQAARQPLLALAAYRLELDSVVARAREPLAAEIRLQWWRDAIRNEGYGEGADLPLVRALREGMRRYLWPADTLCAISEARIHDLYADPFSDWTGFDGYAGETRGAELQLGAMAIAVTRLGEPDGLAAARGAATAAGYAAVALTAAERASHARADFLRQRTAIPDTVFRAATGQSFADAVNAGAVPDGLGSAVAELAAHGIQADGEFRALVAGVPPEARSALLPAMLAKPMLVRGERPLSPFVMQWHLWRGARWLSAQG